MARTRTRLDVALVDRGLVESRSRAQSLIMAGRVTVDGTVVTKAGTPTAEDAELDVTQPPRFVSRAGEKLENGLERFGISVEGELCLDIGASTGGFTDCLLTRGAARVAAVDVGRHQLHERLSADDRVTVIDGLNARNLAPDDLPFRATFLTVDVSFISLKLVLPPAFAALAEDWRAVVLVKPQFEAGRNQVRKGVVRDTEVHRQVLAYICAFVEALDVTVQGICDSCVRGPAGNREYLIALRSPSPANSEEPAFDVESEIAHAIHDTGRPAGEPRGAVHPRTS
jgi:23S rRNA (cytidine1920-2'-O)/16S rRNA (cytidine1409-2'-O)-methyltransferase